MGKSLKSNTKPKVRESDSLVYLTAEQAAELRQKEARRDLMGEDFRNHSGARSKVHKDKKRAKKKFRREDKDAAARGD